MWSTIWTWMRQVIYTKWVYHILSISTFHISIYMYILSMGMFLKEGNTTCLSQGDYVSSLKTTSDICGIAYYIVVVVVSPPTCFVLGLAPTGLMALRAVGVY